MNVAKSLLPLLAVTAISGVVTTLSASEINGKVTLEGTPPPEIPIQMDPYCAKSYTEQPTTHHYVVGKNHGLGNVFVYIKEGAQPAPARRPDPELDQTHCMFQPYVFGVHTGQKIKIKNKDATLHNIHALPKVNKEFNFGQPVQGMVTEKSFDKPEVMVKIKCDVHPWMFAYAGVLDHPYWDVTDKDGNFTIKDVPPGNYTIEVVHLKAGRADQKITLADNEKKTLSFTLKVPSKK